MYQDSDSELYYENNYPYERTRGQSVRDFLSGWIFKNTEEKNLPPMQTLTPINRKSVKNLPKNSNRGALPPIPTDTYNEYEQPIAEGNNYTKTKYQYDNSSIYGRHKKRVKKGPSSMKEYQNKDLPPTPQSMYEQPVDGRGASGTQSRAKKKPIDGAKRSKSPQDMRKQPQNETFKDKNSTYLAPDDLNDSSKKDKKVRKKKSHTSTEVYFAPRFEI